MSTTSAAPRTGGLTLSPEQSPVDLVRRPVAPVALAIVAASLPMFMGTLDNLVMTTALPVIHAQLSATLGDLQWIVNAYTLTFATLMITAATLGDRWRGRRARGRARPRDRRRGRRRVLVGSDLLDQRPRRADLGPADPARAARVPRAAAAGRPDRAGARRRERLHAGLGRRARQRRRLGLRGRRHRADWCRGAAGRVPPAGVARRPPARPAAPVPRPELRGRQRDRVRVLARDVRSRVPARSVPA